MSSTSSETPTTPRRHVEIPDRIDLEGAARELRPLWFRSARDLVDQVLHPVPPLPAHELAPMPSGAEPVLGHLREGIRDPLRAFLRWSAECGPIARIRLGSSNAYLVSDPALVREIFQERHREFVKPIVGRTNLSRILGNGLLVSEGELWLRQRRIAQPAFHRQRIAGFAERFVAAGESLGDEWQARARRAEPFDVARDMMRVTLRIVQETLLGVAPEGDADRIGESVSYILGEVNRRFRRPLQVPERWPTLANQRFAMHRSRLDDAVHAIIRARRASPERGDDLVSMLLEAVDEETGERMDDRQVRDEVMTIFLAGHETTANALSWTVHLLGKHPAVARALRAELAALPARPLTSDDYAALPYTKMVFQEAMRLYPPAWIVARTPREDTHLGGYAVEGGARIFVSPWVVHRNPRVWADPEGFDPERFRDAKTIDPGAYFPFGGGRRICIGQGFAMLEGVLLLATLARRFHLELVPGREAQPEATVTLRPAGGVMVVAREVSAAAR